MPTPRAEPRHAFLLALLTIAATAVLLATGGKSAGQTPAAATGASAWQGLVGSRACRIVKFIDAALADVEVHDAIDDFIHRSTFSYGARRCAAAMTFAHLSDSACR